MSDPWWKESLQQVYILNPQLSKLGVVALAVVKSVLNGRLE